MPFIQTSAKAWFFTNMNSKTIIGINVSALERFDNDAEVTVETLIEAEIVKNPEMV